MGRFRAVALGLAITAVSAVLLLVPQRAAIAHHLCPATGSPFGPFDFETYEAADYRATYSSTLELAGFNQLFPDIPSFALPPLETGDRAADSSQTTDPYIPPVILKSIAWLESGWAMGSYDPLVQYGEVGPALIAHDCGYGIMQVTSGMQNASGVPNLDQAMIGGHYAFNIARGAHILADKWNQAPETKPIVGNRDPHVIENWYFALWGYNGFALENHPLAPGNTWPRPPYDCRPGTDKSIYPYQELVFGCIMNPPVRAGVPLWPAQEVHIPDWSDPAFAGPLSMDNWSACASGNCAAMDIPTPEASHTDPTVISAARDAVLGSPVLTVSKTQVLFTPTIVGSAASTNAVISNSGSGVLAFRIVANAPWLKVTRTQGVALGGDLGARNVTLGITADSAGLAPAFYSAVIRIESLYGGGAPATLTVNMAYNPTTSFQDGSLLKGSGNEIYLLTGGTRRHVPDPQTFMADGFSWGAVQSVGDSTLGTYPAANTLPSVIADGVLLRGSGPEVYVMLGGARRHVPSLDAFSACGYGWDAVHVVDDGIVQSVPDGGPLSGACPQARPPDGSLVRGSDPAVFQIKGGLKRHVPNEFTLETLGLRFSDVDAYADSVVAAIPAGDPLLDASADGNLYRAAGPEVYVTEGEILRHVTSPDVMGACGYDWSAIRAVTYETLGRLSTGTPLEGAPCPRFAPPEGVLVAGSGAAVYTIQSGARRHILDPDIFTGCGYQWGDINVVSDGAVMSLTESEPLGAPPCPRFTPIARASGRR